MRHKDMINGDLLLPQRQEEVNQGGEREERVGLEL